MRTQKAIAVGAILAALALTLFFPVSPGLAQIDHPYFVQGYVYDSTGSPVPAGVRVNITDETKGVTLNKTTDGTGFYYREIYVAIPEAEDGDLFTCSATYLNEGGLCSFILNRAANISQHCDIYLQAAPTPNTHTTTGVAGGGGGGALRTSTPSSLSTPTPTPVVTPTPTPLVMPAQEPSPKPTPTPIPALGAVVPVIPLFIILVAIIAAMITISVAYLVLKVRKKE